MDSVTLSIGVGLVLSVFTAELFSLVAGGMVVPGYLATLLSEPVRIVEIFMISIVTWLGVGGIEKFTVLFGRRKVTITLLIGFIFNMITSKWLPSLFSYYGGEVAIQRNFRKLWMVEKENIAA